MAGALAPVMIGGTSLVPVAAVAVAGGAAVAAVSAAVAAAPAKASTGSVLVLLQNGETSAPEAADVPAGFTVTSVTPATWAGMTAAQFGAYSALVIGDPSAGGTCSSLIPTTATSGADALGTAWQAAVTGNVAVLGTAPALASGGTALVKDAIAYAAAGGATGLYVSLNCEYSTSSAGTAVPLLAGVEGTGSAGGLTVTGQGSACGSGNGAGTVNTLEADQAASFNGLASSVLSAGQWAAPACAVQTTFGAWPANFTPVAYDSSSSATGAADYTASDGVTGQPYVLLGTPPASVSTHAQATAALAPSAGGEVPAGATIGGSNVAAPGVSQATAGDSVNTENGDFSQPDTDVSVPTFGPSLDFTRTYDANLARQQTRSATPGPLGYGTTDNWASSLTSVRPTPGNIYTLDGTAANDGNGGSPGSGVLNGPSAVSVSGSDVYIADSDENRVEEVPGTSKTQWGIAMTSGDMYTIAGSDTGAAGASGNGTSAASSLLDVPLGITLDSAGNLFISDAGNDRVVEIAAVSGTQWGGIAMTAGDLYVIAGRTGQGALGNDSKPATQSDLNGPEALHMGAGTSEDLYIADTGNNRIQEIAGTSGETEWGQAMTLGDVYTVAGSAAGTAGSAGDGGPTGGALLDLPMGVTISGAGDMYIADTGNARVQEVPASTGTQWGTIAMTRFDMYTVAGRTGEAAVGSDGRSATTSDLNFPESVRVTNGSNMYITDTDNNRIQEVANTSHTEFGQSMTADDVYTVAGSPTGSEGFGGNGGLGTSALLANPDDTFLDGSGDIYIADTVNNHVRELSAATGDIAGFAGNGFTLEEDGNGGPATGAGLNNPDGVAADSKGNLYIADTQNNRVQEIAASNHTQWGIAMTAGDTYTVAGDAFGSDGTSGDGGLATAARLWLPIGVAIDAVGDLYIADLGNNRVQEVSAATGDISTIAGSATGANGVSGDGGLATAALLDNPYALAINASGDLYIADELNNRIQEIPAATGSQRGQAMTAGDIYTVAGSAAGTLGSSGDGGLGTSAELDSPFGVAVDPAGNVFISDSGNNRIRELATTAGKRFGQQMTVGDIYTVAGSATGAAGTSGDGGPATKALLSQPVGITADASGDLYISDFANNRIQELAGASGTQWSVSMTAGDVYTVAGSATGATGAALGDGGPATAALLKSPLGVGVDPAGSIYIADESDNRLREVTATSAGDFPESPAPSGVIITQPDGSQVTFYPQARGSCTAPYVPAGGYCTLPQNVGATLTFSSASQTYTYTPTPGTIDTYGWNGALTGEADSAGNTLTAAYSTPAPGSGHCPSAAASCETITSASGRALVIGSNAGGLVTSVTDPLGRATTYAYNSASDLTSVTDPMGNKTSYTYGSGSTGNALLASDLLTITGPNAQPGGPDAGKQTVNVYCGTGQTTCTAGQVTAQTDPMGNTTSFSYCHNAADGDCLNAATGTGIVTVTGPDTQNTAVYSYQGGTLAAQSSRIGSEVISEHDYVSDLTVGGVSRGTLLNTVTADGDGNITTSTYDTAGNATSTTAPDGAGSQTATTTQWSTALGDASCSSTGQAAGTCSSGQGGPATVAPGGVITSPAAAPAQGVTWTLYDTAGNRLYSTTGVYQPGATVASYQQTSYQLFRGNSVTLSGTSITCGAVPPSMSLPCATIDADGVVTQLGYDSAGDLVSSATPDGNGTQVATSSYGYDGDGEQTTAVAPDGNLAGANAGNFTTVTAYNADGDETSVTEAGGTGATFTSRTTSDGYDADGNQTTAQDARGFTTTTAYNADDEPTLATNPDGDATLTCYDGDGNTTQTVPPVGVAANSLTPASCPSTYPAGYGDRLAADATASTFDADGNLTAVTTPAPAGQTGDETTTYAYDGNGNVIKTTAPPTSNAVGAPNQVTVDTYNSAGTLAAETTGSGTSAATTSYCYDPNGDQTAVVAADGNISDTAACETSSPWVVSASSFPTQAAYQTTASYDSVGEQSSTTSPVTTAAPSGGTTSFTYDHAGNKLTSTDPDGVTTTSTYTPSSHLATVSYSASSAHSAAYSYDADGNKTGMTDATGSSSYTYDPFGELTATTNGVGKAIGYGYDADRNATSITYPLPVAATWATSDSVSYGYDHADQMTSLTDFNGHQVAMTNSADGVPSAQALGSSGDAVSITYSQDDGPSVIALQNGTTTLQSFSYSDAPSADVLTESDTLAAAQTSTAYSYDSRGRVTSAMVGTASPKTYSFDASSDLTSLPGSGSASYDHTGELTSSTASGVTTSYSYDSDGRRLTAQQGATVLGSATWNGAGQLTAYNDGNADMTGATYDGTGLRASTATTPSGGSASIQGFVWNSAPSLAQLLMDSTNAYVYGTGATPTEQVSLSTGAVSYLVSDALGSVRGIVSSGSLAATTSYDAWGNPQTPGGLSSDTPFGYAGAYTDQTGLLYLVNRYYDPVTGQFISVDPDNDVTQQPYEYAGDDPVRASDPSGLMPNGVGGGGCSTKECTADHWLFHVTLPRFQAQRDKVCGSAVNEPFKGKNGKQNCWQHGNSHGKFFDWSSDGCSPFPNFENDPVFEGWTVFNWKTGHFWKACERHDFGYRNYKEEGRFSRSTKHHIDENFRHDLNAFICDPMGSPYANECHGLSAAYFEVVEKTPPFSQ